MCLAKEEEEDELSEVELYFEDKDALQEAIKERH